LEPKHINPGGCRARGLTTSGVLAAALICVSTGCGGGIALVTGLAGSGGGSGGSQADAAPVVSFVGEPKYDGSPDRCQITFTVSNDDPGRLRALVEIERRDAIGGEESWEFLGPAKPCPNSNPPSDIAPDEEVTFCWDAKEDLHDASATVRLFVTPIQADGRRGDSYSTVPFRAGNTPASVRENSLSLAQRGQVLLVTFDVVDAESDRVAVDPELFDLQISVGGAEPVKVERDFIRREELFSAPGGADANITLDFADSARRPRELAPLGADGFAGDVVVTIQLRDFVSENWSVKEAAAFPFDYNDAPTAAILGVDVRDPPSGIVPIRYRLFDREQDPASLVVDVDWGDGWTPANEFPAPPSEGIRDLCTLDPRQPEDATSCMAARGGEHVFLWDALSQLRGRTVDGVEIRVRGDDLETGPWSFESVELRGFPGLDRVGEFEAGNFPNALATADFNRDGRLDSVVANLGSNSITHFAGTEEGIRRVGDIPVVGSPTAVTVGDFVGDEHIDVVVGGPFEHNITLIRGTGAGLELVGPMPAGPAPVALAALDFDEDGRLDVVAANWDNPGSVTFLREGADRDLVRVGSIRVAARPVALASGDFIGDTRTDVVVVGSRRNGITPLRGVTGGLFEAGDVIEISETAEGIDTKAELLAGDFVGDAKIDLLVPSFYAGKVTLLRGSESGLEVAGEIDVGTNPTSVSTGDFDADGRLDAAVANSGSDSISFLLNTGEMLQNVAEVTVGKNPRGLWSGDFDGDSTTDIVVTNRDSRSVTLLRAVRGRFEVGGSIRAGSGPGVMASGDFNGDERLDFVVANNGSKDVTLILGARSGPYNLERVLVGDAPRETVSGDFDADGRCDVIVWNANSLDLSLLRSANEGMENAGEFKVGASGVLAAYGSALSTAAGSCIGGERVDLLSVSGPQLKVIRVLGGVLQEAVAIPVVAAPRAIAVSDVTGDSRRDVVVVATGVLNLPGSVSLLQGSEAGLGNAGEIDVGRSPVDVVTGDFDGKGNSDIAVANSGSNSVTVITDIRSVDGLAATVDEIQVGARPEALAAGDFLGDGKLEIVVANRDDDSISLLASRDGRIANRGSIEVDERPDVSARPIRVSAEDLDGDGRLDVAVLNHLSATVTVLRGVNDWLEKVGEFKVGGLPTRHLTLDMDGDGTLDIVSVSNAAGSLSLLRNEGAGLGEIRATTVPLGGPLESLASGDFDGDNRIDLAVSKPAEDSVAILYQRYLTPHASAFLPAPASDDPPPLPPRLIEPPTARGPSRYRLELPERPFDDDTQVCIIPEPSFPLPHGDAYARGRSLRNVTDTFALLREGTRLRDGADDATLTLRLRADAGADIHELKDRLRVVRKDPSTGLGVLLDPVQKPLLDKFEISDAVPNAVRFPIRDFGVYVVALERDRAEGKSP
jgi:hypothetical protein